ncbi:MAG: allantoicase [Saprospiraceae bacterium]
MAHTTVKETIKTAPEFTKLIDLASERLGGKVLYATDDFFAEKENMLKPGRGIFITDKYTDRGKWMDGWESRRKRTPGHDWAIIQLATPGRITGFDIDTNFFLGNHPPHASVEGINLTDSDSMVDWENDGLQWKEILPKSHLDAGSQNFYESQSNEIFTHLRLHMYPDGGIARFKVYGEVFKNWDLVSETDEKDLVAADNGGLAIDCNDMFFSAMGNLIMPGRGINMGDGWETKRNRIPGNRDWVILKLGRPGNIERIIIDTCHFKGNYPDSCLIEACFSINDNDVVSGNVQWLNLLPQQKLSADHIHEYKNEIYKLGEVSHVRLSIFPDGGISRLRLFGKIKK